MHGRQGTGSKILVLLLLSVRILRARSRQRRLYWMPIPAGPAVRVRVRSSLMPLSVSSSTGILKGTIWVKHGGLQVPRTARRAMHRSLKNTGLQLPGISLKRPILSTMLNLMLNIGRVLIPGLHSSPGRLRNGGFRTAALSSRYRMATLC